MALAARAMGATSKCGLSCQTPLALGPAGYRIPARPCGPPGPEGASILRVLTSAPAKRVAGSAACLLGPLDLSAGLVPEGCKHTTAALSGDDVNLPIIDVAPDHLGPRSQWLTLLGAGAPTRRTSSRYTAAPAGGAAPPGHASSVLPTHGVLPATLARPLARERSASLAATGSLTVNVVPASEVETSIWPVWRFTTVAQAMVSPWPVPCPKGLVVKKGWKMRGRTSGAMPGPVSLTLMVDVAGQAGLDLEVECSPVRTRLKPADERLTCALGYNGPAPHGPWVGGEEDK